ncbi:11635_t:CDS:2 [Entrophospora sp. SA101]|nr:11635_t:CDS:2 [Entrophospora sp. SA101]
MFTGKAVLLANPNFESGSFIAKPELDAKPSTHFFNRRKLQKSLMIIKTIFKFSTK